MRILVVEDELRLAKVLADILRERGYEADSVNDGASGLEYARRGGYDAVILDIMLPVMDGLSVLRTLRAEGNTVPVLLLTARSELSQRVAGLDSGANYYLTKPFETEELLACLRSLLRTSMGVTAEQIHFCDLTMDMAAYTLSRGDLSVQLSAKELEMMRILMAGGGSFVSKETLLVKVWGYESDAVGNNVEAFVSFLRKKLAFIHSDVVIESRRMIGYRLREKRD